MTQRDRLMGFVREKIEERDEEACKTFASDMSLLKSGLLDSLAILQLAGWIEREISAVMDLSSVNIVEEWDSVDSILNFIERHNGRAKH